MLKLHGNKISINELMHKDWFGKKIKKLIENLIELNLKMCFYI